MPKIDIDLEMPLDGVYRETRRIYRPDYCQDCPFFLDDHVPWCANYHRRANIGSKPDWCKVNTITINEDL